MHGSLYGNQRSTPQRLFIVLSIIATNAALLALCYWRVGDLISDKMAERGYPGAYWINILIQFTTVGLLYGELGCAALWFWLSKAQIETRIGLYVMSFLLIVVMFVVNSRSGGETSPDFAQEFFVLMGVTCGLLAITGVALHLSQGRAKFVRCLEAGRGTSLRGITISQIILVTTVVAVAFAISSLDRSSSVPVVWVVVAMMVSVFGLLPMAGLLIATSFKRMIVQTVVCVVIASVITLSVSAESRIDVETFAINCVPLLVIIFTPVVWVRLLKMFGYAIESIQRQANVEQGSSAAIFDDVGDVAEQERETSTSQNVHCPIVANW